MRIQRVFWAVVIIAAIVGIAEGYNSLKALASKVRADATKYVKVQQEKPTAIVAPAYDRLKFIPKLYQATTLMYFPTEEGGEKMACTATAFQKVLGDKGRPVGYLFVSASHCVDDKKTVDLTRDEFPDGGKKVFYHAVVVAQSNRATGVDASVLLVVTDDYFETIPIGHNPTHLGETILNLSGPQGAPKQVFPGFVTSLYMNRPIVLEDGSNWEGFVMVMMPGEGPGSSGSMVVCESQQAACALTVGHVPGGMVALPIDRFRTWWQGVVAGKINPHPSVRSKEEQSKSKRIFI